MALSKPKFLIVSDGEKTYAILNGVPCVGNSFEFSHKGGEGVRFSMQDVRSESAFTLEDFYRFAESLGYKLRAE